jgi:hypothetical protein
VVDRDDDESETIDAQIDERRHACGEEEPTDERRTNEFGEERDATLDVCTCDVCVCACALVVSAAECRWIGSVEWLSRCGVPGLALPRLAGALRADFGRASPVARRADSANRRTRSLNSLHSQQQVRRIETAAYATIAHSTRARRNLTRGATRTKSRAERVNLG